ncbi:hypothetical protein ACH40F_27415 [Streptomyces sp. NPDC020794]|uniref:hypothetical protein n=1 Tax=unclassified Streptomyces TaxID=2593676 RepID=UPI0036EA5A3E
MTTTATERRFKGNGLPDHPTGRFPVRKGTLAYKYYAEIPAHGYPNAAAIPIKPWNLDVTVPRDPSVRARPTCIDCFRGEAGDGAPVRARQGLAAEAAELRGLLTHHEGSAGGAMTTVPVTTSGRPPSYAPTPAREWADAV